MDVETILNEIRHRVVAQGPRADEPATAVEAPANGSAIQSQQAESLTRVSAHLAVTGRAWDRLPPVITNRQGALARLELWIKRKSKPLTRWFTWEQVNFNRAVNDALGDLVEILQAETYELASLRAEMRRQLSLLQSEAAAQTRELQNVSQNQMQIEARLEQADTTLARAGQLLARLSDENRGRFAGIDQHFADRDTQHARLANEHAQLANEHVQLANEHAQLANEYAQMANQHANLQLQHSNLEAEHTKLANQVVALAVQLRSEEQEIQTQQDRELNRRLTEMAADLKAEQHVCFRQISLEATESAILEDRARRGLLARLEKLEESLKQSQPPRETDGEP